jgi:hypothetical protein
MGLEARKLSARFHSWDTKPKDSFCTNEWAEFTEASRVDCHCATRLKINNDDKRVTYCVRNLKSYDQNRIDNLIHGDWLYDACLAPTMASRDRQVKAALARTPTPKLRESKCF